MRGSLDHCVKCTICETFCPVSNVTPLFPGPKYVGPQAERFRVRDEPSPDASLDYCSGCGICTQVCPQGVHIAEINTQARAQLKATTGAPRRDRLLARPTLAGRLGTPVAPIANRALGNRLLRAAAERTIGLDRRAPVPRFAGRTFQAWARRHERPVAQKRVAFFHGCGINYYEPRLGEMTVALLEHNGFAVDVPRQGCCGLPLQSNGLFDDARGYVHRLAARLAPYAREGVDIVATSTSCSLMLKREALEILGMEDDPDLKVVSERMFDICEYLLELHERGELRTDFRPLPETVTYHAPCQQQGHGIGKPALDLLALVPELRTIELDATCCGIAGTYGLAREMGGGEVQIEAAGGMEDGALGTDAARVYEAVERVRSPDGVLVLMDLGSALMSAEMAVEMADPDGGPILLSEAPLVEGAVAAVARARGGASLEEVAREARGALAMKSAQLGGDEAEQPADRPPPVSDEPERPADRPQREGGDAQELRLVVNNRLGLHARPAARFVGVLAGIEAHVEVVNESRGRGPADGRSLTGLATLAVGQGDEIVVTA